MARSLRERLFGPAPSNLPVLAEPKRLLAQVKDGALPETKSSMSLLPRGAYGPNYVFFSPDGGRTMIDVNDGPATLAFIAYWYVAVRWRAQKIAEPPLMVVKEDQGTGDDEWIPKHELVPILEEPSPDYDMGELLETTSHYLDNTGACLWVLDQDRIGRTARITPFSRHEFEPIQTTDRLFGSFRVQTANGPTEFSADSCVLFRDQQGSLLWNQSRSRLDVAMSWLKLGARAQQTVYDLLSNSVWPSAAIVTDKDWDPDPETYAAYKQDLQAYAKSGNKGKPFVALGGGQFVPLQTSIKDLVPSEVLSRVESIVSAISGVPAIVLQFQIGMENAPWSQMGEARKMAYDDCITPAWRKIERVLTRQLLRPIDEDPTHFIRFDDSNVAALQSDQLVQVQIASLMGRAASLNERRSTMGLEPVKNDPKADEIPELTAPSFADILAGNAGGNNANTNTNDPNTNNADPNKKPNAADIAAAAAAKKTDRQRWMERKFKAAVLQDVFRQEAIPIYQIAVHGQLRRDAEQIAEIVTHMLLDADEAKAIETKKRGKDSTMTAVAKYLSEQGRSQWTRVMQPLNEKSAQRAGAVLASDLNINFSLLNGNLLTYARKQTAKQITDVNATTRAIISDIIQGGLDAGASTKQIANLIRDATGFAQSRAELIARTETTKAFNGAPTESLVALGDSQQRTFTKTWSGVLDDRERDEHVAMEGETVPIDEPYSNGLMYPSEPNCRCTSLFDETTGD